MSTARKTIEEFLLANGIDLTYEQLLGLAKEYVPKEFINVEAEGDEEAAILRTLPELLVNYRERITKVGQLSSSQKPEEEELVLIRAAESMTARSKEEGILFPKFDFFKELLGEKSICKAFLSAVLKIPYDEITDLEYAPTHLQKDNKENKEGIMDVSIVLNKLVKVDIEMQVILQTDWGDRVLYYMAKMSARGLNQDEKYGDLRKCINISVLGFNLFKEVSEYHSCFHLREDNRGTLLTDKVECHIIELPKVNNMHDTEDRLLLWSKFFGTEKKEEFSMLASQDAHIEDAWRKLQELSKNNQMLDLYDAYEKRIRDEYHRLLHYEEKGIEKGEENVFVNFNKLKNLIYKQGFLVEEALIHLSIPEAKWPMYKEMLE